MEFLSANGFTVPEAVISDDRLRQVDGMVMQRWLHEVTAGWPQRPGFAATADLLTDDHGGDVDLTAMPDDAVTACRAAWRSLTGPHTVVHGDPGGPNVRVAPDGAIGLLDWDEARVDHPDLDLADLPVPVLPDHRARVARAAVDAWEAAAGWVLEPTYARGRLAELRAR